MKATKQARRDAKQLFRCCLVNGALDEGRVRQAVSKLGSLKPRGFAQILGHMLKLVQMDIARRTAVVESAEGLTDGLRQGVVGNLQRMYGSNLMISFKENPGLLGGLRIRVGSDVFDGSVQARLRALEESF